MRFPVCKLSALCGKPLSILEEVGHRQILTEGDQVHFVGGPSNLSLPVEHKRTVVNGCAPFAYFSLQTADE